MLGGLRKLGAYLVGKRSELEDLELKDAVLAKTILDIHRKKSGKETVMVPLFALHPVHAIDRPSAEAATAKRAAVLREHRPELLELGQLTQVELARFLPSVSWIKVVCEAEERYISFEGNGRIAALQAVFCQNDKMQIEVEEYVFARPAKIVRRLRRVQRMNGLQD